MVDVCIYHQWDILKRWVLAININTLYLDNGINTLYLDNNSMTRVTQLLNNNWIAY